MTDIVLSIVMLAALALVGGAFVQWRRTGEAKNPALMVLLAVIAVINVLIWTVPTSSGEAPITQIRAPSDQSGSS
jgi:drug/metabolite transporter superfamily protein YnfA